ncbi:MAG: hypothetical protein ACK59C_04540 [Holosporales bacterium]|jgi:hypothetical protein
MSVEYRLCALADAERLHHGVLLSGMRGSGKRALALRLAQYLLTTKAEAGVPPGYPARLLASGAHPDFLLLEGEDGVIKIDAVRPLMGFLTKKPALTRYKVVIVDCLDAMTHQAANALLKVLEEPPGACHFFLLAHRLAGVLPTVRSRCFVVAIPRPDEVHFVKNLEVQGITLTPEEAAHHYHHSGGNISIAAPLLEEDHREISEAVEALIKVMPNVLPGQVLAVGQKLIKAPPAVFTAVLERLAGAHYQALRQAALAGATLSNEAMDKAAKRWNFYRRDSLRLHYDRQQVWCDAVAVTAAAWPSRASGLRTQTGSPK